MTPEPAAKVICWLCLPENAPRDSTERLPLTGPCRIEREFIPHYGLPVWALTWLLSSYAAGLPDDVRQRFLRMRVEEFMEPAARYLDRDWVTSLSAQKNIELACVNTVVARKI